MYPQSTEQVERKNRALSSSNGEKTDLKTAYNQHLRKMSNQNSREASIEDLPTYNQSKQPPAFENYVAPPTQHDHVQSSNQLLHNSNSFKVSDSSMNSIYQRIQNLRNTLAQPTPTVPVTDFSHPPQQSIESRNFAASNLPSQTQLEFSNTQSFEEHQNPKYSPLRTKSRSLERSQDHGVRSMHQVNTPAIILNPKTLSEHLATESQTMAEPSTQNYLFDNKQESLGSLLQTKQTLQQMSVQNTLHRQSNHDQHDFRLSRKMTHEELIRDLSPKMGSIESKVTSAFRTSADRNQAPEALNVMQ